MIRVLLCGSIPPEWGGRTGGGVASVHRTLAQEFVTRGHHYGVEVAGMMPFNLDPTASMRPPVADVVELPPSGARAADEMAFYGRTLERTRADVVLFQHIGHKWAVYHARLAPGAPAVGVVHSWHALMFRPAEQIERARRTVDQSLPGCASLVFVSESVRTEGAERGFDFSVRTSVIHNPFGPTYAEPCAVDARRRDGWVFVGALTERKSPMLALEAAARCGASLVFVGEGPEEVALRAATERLGLGDRVDFEGWATPEGVRDALLRADLLCLPSLSEGFSVAYLEALACGLPVIGAATNVAELERQMGAPCGVGIRGDDVGEVVAAAQAIRATTWVRTELRRRALAAFSPSAVAQRYATVLHESVSGRRR